MKNSIIVLGSLFLGLSLACSSPNEKTEKLTLNEERLPIRPEEVKTEPMPSKSFYEFTVKDINGDDLALSSLKGKRILIVNTASECGYTGQYEDLQELYDLYGGDNFTILGFPSNNFGGQEPGSNDEIKSFCQKNYGVTFPMMSKINVKGSDQHELYMWLTDKDQNGVDNARVGWNFNKFLIDEKGFWVKHYGSNKGPLSDDIVAFAKGE
jgi:glutathione peroxidase